MQWKKEREKIENNSVRFQIFLFKKSLTLKNREKSDKHGFFLFLEQKQQQKMAQKHLKMAKLFYGENAFAFLQSDRNENLKLYIGNYF